MGKLTWDTPSYLETRRDLRKEEQVFRRMAGLLDTLASPVPGLGGELQKQATYLGLHQRVHLTPKARLEAAEQSLWHRQETLKLRATEVAQAEGLLDKARQAWQDAHLAAQDAQTERDTAKDLDREA